MVKSTFDGEITISDGETMEPPMDSLWSCHGVGDHQGIGL